MKKFIAAILLAATLAATLIVPAAAAKADDNSIFLKQETNVTCTLASAAMMLRMRAALDNNDNWSTITEASMKKQGAWPAGLANNIKYKDTANGLNMQTATTTLYAMQNNSHKKNTNTSAVIKKLKALLDEHPEGIVLYLYERHLNSKGKSVSSWQHAVLLTGYTDTALYCVDPSKLVAKKEINILDSTLASKSMTNADTLSELLAYSIKVWYVKSADNKRTSSNADISDLLKTMVSPFTEYFEALSTTTKKVAEPFVSAVSSTAGSVSSTVSTVIEKIGANSDSTEKKAAEKDTAVYAKVYKTSTLNMRKSATTSSAILASLPKGARVEILSTAKKNGFYKISYKGKIGYASANYLDIE